MREGEGVRARQQCRRVVLEASLSNLLSAAGPLLCVLGSGSVSARPGSSLQPPLSAWLSFLSCNIFLVHFFPPCYTLIILILVLVLVFRL